MKGTGRATACHIPYIDEGARCVPPSGRIAIPGGTLTLSPNDWQAEGQVARRTLTVTAFWLDATEFIDDSSPEPFLPLTGITAERAEALCEARGGRLPTADEWVFAAAGADGRKYPWGQTGLVCRRAAFGLVSGPCGFAETPGPEAVASRPDGRSPEGAFDLIGNVAEWARLATSGDMPRREHRALGGSFRSELASELKVWSQDAPEGPRDDVGFRCAYDE